MLRDKSVLRLLLPRQGTRPVEQGQRVTTNFFPSTRVKSSGGRQLTSPDKPPVLMAGPLWEDGRVPFQVSSGRPFGVGD